MKMTRLDEKLARIAADPSGTKEFVICDAKDSDMGFGLAHGGAMRARDGSQNGRLRGREMFLEQVRAIVEQDIVDLILLSVSNMDQLVTREKLFETSDIAVGIRANDTTDAWVLRNAGYREVPSMPFRTAEIGDCVSGENGRRADIGLYSITFNNDAEADRQSLEAFRDFRRETVAASFPYFLEVFNPNVGKGLSPEGMPFYVNDCIIRSLAAVPQSARPRFLKVVYNGPRAMEELAGYDPGLIVGVLGGGSGTTYDCLKLLHDAKKYGARIALFGRKINLAEDPLGMIRQMRLVADGDVSPAEAVKAYHAGLAEQKIVPFKPLEDDLRATDPVLM